MTNSENAFAAFIRERGHNPTLLASDLARLGAFIQGSASDLAANADLTAAAEVFMGDLLAARRTEARWETVGEGQRLVGNQRIKFDPVRIIAKLVKGDPSDVEQLATVVRDWEVAPDRSSDAFDPLPRPILFDDDQPLYVRPLFSEERFRDSRGELIPYGERWGESGPPEDSYSIESNLERFVPLHAVADALIEYLVGEYDVTVEHCSDQAAQLINPRDDVLRTVSLTPADPDAASLTVVYTELPGVVVHAGVLHDFVYPSCGCDACDETAIPVAGELESIILSVVTGGYAEKYPMGAERWCGYALVAADGSGHQSGQGAVGLASPAGLSDAAQILERVPDGWHPWPRRGGAYRAVTAGKSVNNSATPNR